MLGTFEYTVLGDCNTKERITGDRLAASLILESINSLSQVIDGNRLKMDIDRKGHMTPSSKI